MSGNGKSQNAAPPLEPRDPDAPLPLQTRSSWFEISPRYGEFPKHLQMIKPNQTNQKQPPSMKNLIDPQQLKEFFDEDYKNLKRENNKIFGPLALGILFTSTLAAFSPRIAKRLNQKKMLNIKYAYQLSMRRRFLVTAGWYGNLAGVGTYVGGMCYGVWNGLLDLGWDMRDINYYLINHSTYR